MRIHRLMLAAAALAAMLAPRLARAQQTGLRWDIVHLASFNPVTIQPGGQASAIEDSENWKLTLTGSGTFVPGQPERVTGGGTWLIADAKGGIVSAGSYLVTRLVQWTPYCGTAPSELPSAYVDQIAPAQAFREGTAVLTALFSDASAPGEAPQSGVLTLFDRPDLLALPPAAVGAGTAAASGAHTAALTVACCMPAPLPLGLTATLGFHAFWSREAATPLVDGDRVAFHAAAVP